VDSGVTPSGLLKPRKYKLVDIISSKATLDRALDVANGFYLELEKRGHSVVLEPHGQRLRRHAVVAGLQKWPVSASQLTHFGFVTYWYQVKGGSRWTSVPGQPWRPIHTPSMKVSY